MALAIFDLDNTLLNGDSDHAWGEFLCERGIVDTAYYKAANDRFYQHYIAGNLDIDEFLNFALAPLKEHSCEQLNAWHQEFMQAKVQPMLQEKALEILAKHRAQGDYLLIITATNLFVTKPIAELLKVDHIIATTPEQVNGEYTGKYTGIATFQEGKIASLNEWLKDNNFDLSGSYFYSDSRNDLPLLEIVDHPIVVDGDEHLLAVAEKKGWPSISFR